MKKEYSHIDEENFNRYLDDQMTKQERNLFEKELQKNPFEDEALEGFLNLNSSQIQKDLSELKAKIHPVKRKTKYRYWAAAATFLLLVTSGIIWVQLNENQAISEIAENRTVQKHEKKIVTSDKQEETISVNKILQPQVSEQYIEAKPEVKVEKSEVNYEAKKSKEILKSESIKPSEIASRKKILIAESTPENVINLKDSETEPTQNIGAVGDILQAKDSNVIFMIEDLKQEQNNRATTAEYSSFKAVQNVENISEPVAFAPVEELLTEKEIAKSTSKNHFEILTDSKVQPEIGMPEFEKYLKNKAVLPINFPKRKEVVKLLLSINSRGEITEIQNKNKADSLIFEKAKEIITNGPKWMAEIKNDIPVESEIELKIIFRK